MSAVRVAVVTVTCPGRETLLVEAEASVENQTLPPITHLVETNTAGPDTEGKVRNRLIARARDEFDCNYVAILDDDDVLDPHHLETLVGALDTAATRPDLVYPQWRWHDGTTGSARPWDAGEIMRVNRIPVTVLLGVAIWETCGGFKDIRHEDWELWKEIARRGGHVLFVDEVTWTYRRSGGRGATWHG